MSTNVDEKVIERIAYEVKLAKCADPVTLELYGYHKTVVNEAATFRRFCEAYRDETNNFVSSAVKEVALDVIRHRIDRYNAR